MKRPVLMSFLVGVVVSLALGGYMVAQSRTVDEQPFIIYYSLIALPVAWFFAWIFLAALGWWLEITDQPPRGD